MQPSFLVGNPLLLCFFCLLTLGCFPHHRAGHGADQGGDTEQDEDARPEDIDRTYASNILIIGDFNC